MSEASVRRVELEAPGLRGLSGLALDGRGDLWTIPEHGGALARIDQSGRVQAIPLLGAPGDVDIEGIAWLGGRRFALGTESKAPSRRRDKIALVEVRGGAARAYATLDFPYPLWRLRGDANQGIEGLCRAGDSLFAAAETVGQRGGRRYAPLGRYDLSAGRWVPYRLWLTTRTGKISALACRQRAGGIELLAVERHFEVTRILRARLSPGGARAADVVPYGALDVTAMAAGENLEGIAWLPGGDVALVVDNAFRDAVGPNALVLVPRGRLR